jgi:hypothetical protein
VKQVALTGGGKAQIRPNGQIRSADRNGMHIEHNLHGGRTIVSERNGKRIVTTGKHGGYVQRPLTTRGGHAYYARTSYDHGIPRSGVYRGYSYGGHVYYGYQAGSYYHPAFYSWAAGTWASPLAWGVGAWGWGGAPWYAYYGFAPYPFYAGPSFWLTDYLIAANLQAAYAGLAGDGGPGINVIANQPWTDTGVQVEQGKTYNITASGVVNYSGGNASTVATPTGIGPGDGNSLVPALPSMSLIGRIGPAGVPFYVGNRKSLVAPVSGDLFLGMNDASWGFGDNSGAWVATINPAGGDAPVAAGGMPLRIVENENGSADSPTWSFHGRHGVGVFTSGNQPLTIEKFDGTTVSVRRKDTSGNWLGSALYVGQIEGDLVSGQVTYYDPSGGIRSAGWHGKIESWSPSADLGDSSAAPTATGSSDPVALTPEVKAAIAEEVKAQIAAEQAAAGPTAQAQPSSQELPPALDPARRNFVVSADLAVIADGQECSLTAGDVITRLTDTPDQDQKVNVSVTSSKKHDCVAGKLVAVSVDDLQEMRNHFQEQLDAGLKTMAAKQGTGGMPKAPDAGTVASSIAAPAPDKTAANDLQDQQTAADQTEAEVTRESGNGTTGGAN